MFGNEIANQASENAFILLWGSSFCRLLYFAPTFPALFSGELEGARFLIKEITLIEIYCNCCAKRYEKVVEGQTPISLFVRSLSSSCLPPPTNFSFWLPKTRGGHVNFYEIWQVLRRSQVGEKCSLRLGQLGIIYTLPAQSIGFILNKPAWRGARRVGGFISCDFISIGWSAKSVRKNALLLARLSANTLIRGE